MYWYEQAVKTDDHDEGGEYDSTMHDPTYQLLAKQAELYLSGGHGLDKDAQKSGKLGRGRGEYDCTMHDPTYQLLAKQAELYLSGGHGLDKDAQKAGKLDWGGGGVRLYHAGSHVPTPS